MRGKLLSGIVAVLLAVGVVGVGSGAPASLPTAQPEAVGMSSERLARIAPVMQQDIDRQLVPAFVTLIARRGHVVYFEAQGWQDVASRTPVQKDSLFRMYSMTKPMTAVALLMLYEEGRLQLDDPVSRYIPAYRNQRVRTADGGTVPANRDITLRDVMTNTAGVPPYSVGYEPGIDTESPMIDVVNRLAEYPLNFQPGTAYEYGFGIGIAGVVVEIVSGKTLEDFFQERIFRPLGMSDSSFFVPASKASRLMTQYAVRQEAGGMRMEASDLYSSDKVNGPKVQFGGDGWGGGVVSTAQDYARFAQMLLNYGELDGVRLLSRKSVELMATSLTGNLVIGGAPAGYGWGLGVSVLRDIAGIPGIGSVGRFGWGGAANTNFFVDPKEEMIAVRLSQVLGGSALPTTGRNVFDTLVYQALE